jgi:D-alanine-D-alanine ligase
MTKVHVLAGGTSNEREVSLRSGRSVAAALRDAGYDVAVLDPADTAMTDIVNCDVVFPAMHGAGAEDGTLQAELEKHHVQYVGTGPEASSLCFDKGRYREFIKARDLPIAEGALVTQQTYRNHRLFGAPYVLKPVDGGSSLDVHIVRDPVSAPHEAIEATFSKYKQLLLELLIEGIELTVGVLGDKSLPAIEIIPPADGEFDYENKYNGASQELCPPQHVSETVQRRAQELALHAHTLCGCRDLSRTDIMYETSTDKLYILETNTLPGMTDQSLYPKAAAANGLSMPELCSQLVQFALKR